MNKEASNSSVLSRFYLLVVGLTLFAFVLIGKLIYIQFFIGEEGVNVGSGTIIKNVVLEPSRGNIYSADGNILATSIPRYELHWDAVVPSETVFNINKKNPARAQISMLTHHSTRQLQAQPNSRVLGAQSLSQPRQKKVTSAC